MALGFRGIVSTPADLNTFIRAYVGGKLFDERTLAKQRRVIEGGSSEPPGPGKNSAGLAIFRYETRCGTVWGHTGNIFGYTQFAAASEDGRRSVTVSINAQHTLVSGNPVVFEALRRAEVNWPCAPHWPADKLTTLVECGHEVVVANARKTRLIYVNSW